MRARAKLANPALERTGLSGAAQRKRRCAGRSAPRRLDSSEARDCHGRDPAFPSERPRG